jgi:hypothetical protein
MTKQAALKIAIANARRLDAMGQFQKAQVFHKEAARLEQQIRSM